VPPERLVEGEQVLDEQRRAVVEVRLELRRVERLVLPRPVALPLEGAEVDVLVVEPRLSR
jgi:hypothetical protein